MSRATAAALSSVPVAPPRRRTTPGSLVLPRPRRRTQSPLPTWEEIAAWAPRLAQTMTEYLDQIAVSSRPGTVSAADLALRTFVEHLMEAHPTCCSVKSIGRPQIESYKLALAKRPGKDDESGIAVATIRHKLGMLRTFFDRLVEWDVPDAPKKTPIYAGDIPKADEPLPRFLDDPTYAKFMAVLAKDTNLRRRVIVELLARTGMRVGEITGLRDDAVFRLGDEHWLRIPVGKLHNDRTVPLHRVLVELIEEYRRRRGPSPSGLLVVRDDGQPFDRRTVHRYVVGVAKRAGIAPIHPHQLRHTLATQAINRGMSLEAIAALLGHKSMRMTMTYARISDRTVADEYFRVTEAVESNHGRTHVLPDSTAGTNMRRLAADHRRMLGNGMCTRPVALDCSFESACERCTFFETGPQFIPILRRQRDHAVEQDQTGRVVLFQKLIEDIDGAG